MSTNKSFRQTIAEENEKMMTTTNKIPIPTSVKYNLSTTVIKNYTNIDGKIMLFSGFTDDAIVYFSKLNKKICALNFANARNPGGGYLRGSLAQEEELCRQYPTLHSTLSNMKNKYNQYPLKFGELIYSYDVLRMRDNFKKQYKIIPIHTPAIVCDFITCASPNLNQRTFAEILPKEHEHIIRSIDLMFKVAINNDVKILILGAWGCGAFSPTDNIHPTFTYTTFMATEFKKCAEKYVNQFDIIVFAVPDDVNGKIFSNCFK